MKTLLIITIPFIWLGLTTVLAQTTATSTKAFAHVTPDGKAVQLKWLIFIPRKIQYHILRRNINEKSFTRLTTTPLQPTTAVDPKASATVQAGQQKYLKVVQAIPKKNEAKFFLKLFATTIYIDNAFAQAAGMFFEDKTTIPGQTYVYAVNAIYNGKEYNWAQSLPVRAGSYKSELAPVGLNITQETTNRVALNWTIRPAILAYNVYRRRGTTGAEVKLNKEPQLAIEAVGGKTPASQFIDTDSTLRVGETYYYRIAALDPFVNPGEFSQPVWLTIKDMDPPAVATSLHGRVEKRGIRLGWKPSLTRDCIGYRLFRSTSMDKPFQPVLPRLLATTDTTFTDETAREGETYYYYLRAEDQAGNGANTLPVQISHPDLTPPASPTGLVAQTDTTGHVRLSWRGNTEPDLAGYFVYRGLTQHDDNYAQLRLTPHKLTTFPDTLLRNNRNLFYYRVTAVDKVGNESKPAPLTVRLPDRRPPATPRLQTLMATGDLVQVTWQASSSEDVRIYHVLRQNENDAKPAYQVVGRTTTNRFADRKVPGGTYSYTLQAVDSTGNQSKPSIAQLVRVTGRNPLTAPADVNVQIDERGKRLLVNWNRVPQSADFVGYRVLARDQGETFRAITPLLTENQAVLTDWENGSDYEIAVVAVSQSGQQLKSQPVKATPGK